MPFGVSRRDAPPWEGLLRALGVIFIFMGVIWLFWKHHARTLEMLETQRFPSHEIILDRTATLTEEQKKAVHDLFRAMKTTYGLELQVVVDVKPIVAPTPDARTVFVGLYPEGRQAVIVLPPLAERAIGQELANHLRREHFTPYWQSGNWPRGLGEALGLIWDGLHEPGSRPAPMNGQEYRGRVEGQGQ